MILKILIMSLIFLVLQGCGRLPPMGNGIPADAIVMGRSDEISVDSTSNKTVIGQDITKFYCSVGVKKCDLRASRKYCTCEIGPIYLPPRMGL